MANLTIEEIKRRQIEEYGRIFDYGTVSALSQALREVLDLFIDSRTLDRLDDDEGRGRRPATIRLYATPSKKLNNCMTNGGTLIAGVG
jgi:hypothetical protein